MKGQDTGIEYEKELKFKQFVRKLLEVQTYNFLEEHLLFTPQTLKEILTEFCNIIAKDLKAESCTINLKMYNPADFRFIQDNAGEKIEKLKETHGLDEKESRKIFEDARKGHMKSHQTFPYWQYPKGASRLVAANEKGPWHHLSFSDIEADPETGNVDDKKPDLRTESDTEKEQDAEKIIKIIWNEIRKKNRSLGFAQLDSGVSKSIYQENMPAILDRFSMRFTRKFKKIGGADKFVWNNSNWKYVFKNFYGAPIRIHPAGEVIGILKVENKEGVEKYAQFLKKNWYEEHDIYISDFIGEILDELSRKDNGDERKVSLLSLAYLQNDLTTDECKGKSLNELYYIPFPDYNHHLKEDKKGNFKSLIPADRAPIQIHTKSLKDEMKLWEKISPNLSRGEDIKNLFKEINEFYSTLNNNINKRVKEYEEPVIAKKINDELLSLFESQVIKITVESWIQIKNKLELPDFYFQAEIEFEDTSITIFLFIPPTREQLNSSDCLEDKKEAYEIVNRNWIDENDIPITNIQAEFKEKKDFIDVAYSGEFVEYNDIHGKRERVTDFLVDRLAARSQAFVHSIPVNDFSPEDTHKLSWAAFEIGKLIEREISYKANRSDDPMPLTAMEFFRIPISDLSFVDDLRNRRNGLKRIQKNFDHQIEELIYDMSFNEFIRYKSRIKEYRSALLRLGERYEGYVRGNMAIWVYLLSLIVEKDYETEVDSTLKKIQAVVRTDIKDSDILNEENRKILKDKLKNDMKGKKGIDKSITKFNDLCQKRLFLDNLVSFKNKVEQIIIEKDKKVGEYKDEIDFYTTDYSDFLGDLKFDSPPFKHAPASKKELIDALKTITSNLASELFITEEQKNSLINDPPNNEKFKLAVEELEDLLFRNYDEYARASLSLLIQILNQINQLSTGNSTKDEFLNFYELCYNLRSILCTSPREIEDNHKYWTLREVFGEDKLHKKNHWFELLGFIDDFKTTKFGDLFKFAENEKSNLFLSAKSIYKRIRTLHNILHHQRSAATLDWELGRYDLFGFRANCLFKNQVFALYEHIWNNGDPFFFYNYEKNEFPDFSEQVLKPELRAQWLCLRTNVLSNEYNALQVAALIDPNETALGFWSQPGYNLKRAKYVLGNLFKKFHPTDATEYQTYAYKRNLLRKKYTKWHRKAFRIAKHESPLNTEDRNAIWFGSFLFEGVFDLLIFLFDTWIEKVNTDDNLVLDHTIYNSFREIMISLPEILKAIDKYRQEIEKNYKDSKKSFSGIKFDCSECKCVECDGEGYDASSIWIRRTKHCKIYYNARKILEYLRSKLKEKNDNIKLIVQLEGDLKNLYYERVFFEEKLDDKFDMPLFFLDWRFHGHKGRCSKLKNSNDEYDKCCEKNNNKENCNKILFKDSVEAIGGINSSDKISLESCDFLVRTLMNIRRCQKSYLFKEDFGLSARNKESSLSRIKNYILLFDPDEFKKEEFNGWTAYDFYYYMRSLVPVEIQIRTELADTVAEQYHGPVYKGRPPLSTEFPKKMMEEIGRKLDGIDLEMEIDYEDYIDRYYKDEQYNKDFEKDFNNQ